MQKTSRLLKNASSTESAKQQKTVRDGIAALNLLENASMAVKIAVIAAVLVLGTLVVLAVSLRGLGTMRYHVGNLYDFMLVPIESLAGADTQFSDIQRRLDQMSSQNLGSAQDDNALAAIEATSKSSSAVIERYNAEWVTTTSPDFTATLARLGRLDLQTRELAALKSLNENHANVVQSLTQYIKSVRAGGPDIGALAITTGLLDSVRVELKNLILVSDEFAKISAGDAIAASNQANLFSLIALTVSVVVGLLLTLVVVRSITRRLDGLRRAVTEIGQGNFDTVAAVRGLDEIGALGRDFNGAATQLLNDSNAKREQEVRQRLELQENVSGFLSVATDIAQGDLTRRGTVTQDALGSVADAINLALEEIGLLLKEVSQTATLVDQGANQMGEMSAHIAQSADGQAKLAEQARARALEVTQSIRAMAQGALQTAQVAQRTLQSSQQGQAAVQETLSGMDGIRRETENLAENVRQMASRSKEIQGIVRTIANFASQTNLLALGAALEAAGAGESGKRFAAVADQVRRLADESTRATQQVAGLMKGFESEMNALVERAEGSTREVEQGYSIATQAGARLEEIAQLARQSAALVQRISNATQQQVKNVEQVGRAAQVIAETASQTGSESLKGSHAADHLRQLSVQLVSNLSRFRLPN